jgi:hypothetical protein
MIKGSANWNRGVLERVLKMSTALQTIRCIRAASVIILKMITATNHLEHGDDCNMPVPASRTGQKRRRERSPLYRDRRA